MYVYEVEQTKASPNLLIRTATEWVNVFLYDHFYSSSEYDKSGIIFAMEKAFL